MLLILLYLLQLLAFIALFQIEVFSNELLSLLFILINSSLVVVYIARAFKSNTLLAIFVLGLFFRLVVLFLDLYSDIPIIHSGSDTEDFHSYAQMNISSGLYLYHKTNYTKILTLIYSVTESSRLIAQYLNIVLAMVCNILVIRIQDVLGVDFSVKKLSSVILNFFPTYLIISSILLREMLVIFFMIYSIYYFIKWLNCLGRMSFLKAVVLILASAYFHSGTVAVLFFYLIAFIVYNPLKNKIKITLKSLPAVLVASVVFLIFILNMDIFGSKFTAISEGNNALDYINEFSEASRGDSAYLSWLKISSPLQLLIYSPLKIVYFLFSPLPIDWRSVYDIISFLLDSFLYIIITLFFFKKARILRLRTKLLLALVIAIILIYSLGVSNTGTAIRHRSKILPIVVLLYGLAKKDEKNEILFNNIKSHE